MPPLTHTTTHTPTTAPAHCPETRRFSSVAAARDHCVARAKCDSFSDNGDATGAAGLRQYTFAQFQKSRVRHSGL